MFLIEMRKLERKKNEIEPQEFPKKNPFWIQKRERKVLKEEEMEEKQLLSKKKLRKENKTSSCISFRMMC